MTLVRMNGSKLYIKIPWPGYFFSLIFLIFHAGIGAGLESMSHDTVNRLSKINPKVYFEVVYFEVLHIFL